MAKASNKTVKKTSTTTKLSGKKEMINANAYSFLKEYINNPSPVGFESSGQKLWLNYITKYVDTTFTDPYGTAVGVINPDAPFKVVIEAHADEISWFVNYINDQGLIYLKRNGGVDHQIAPSMRVWIHGKKGPVKAVFGWPAIHTRLSNPEQKEPQPKVDNLTLHCVARSQNELEALGIHIGSVVTYQEGIDE
jgi:putative aminopeptidase FrvX